MEKTFFLKYKGGSAVSNPVFEVALIIVKLKYVCPIVARHFILDLKKKKIGASLAANIELSGGKKGF